MVDLSVEDIISIDQAARLIPGRGGRPMNFSTIWRWIMKGTRGPHGAVVRLRAPRAGPKWMTSTQAIHEFLGRLTPCLDGDPVPRSRTPTRRQQASERAA